MSTLQNREAKVGPLFRFKNARVSLNELILLDYEPDRLHHDLAEHAGRLPSLFRQMPILINLEQLPDDVALPSLEQLLGICRENALNPVGIRGNSRYDSALIAELGLADFGSGGREKTAAPAESEPVEAVAPAEPESEPAQAEPESAEVPHATGGQTRLITAPVRSGQQIYAAGGDLIVLSSVGAGAEVMADGNIHIYGPLRGRAMAGVKGNSEARIFCQSLEAELVSIAGYFKTSEDLMSDHWKQPVQAWLSGTKLDTAPL
ncbi:septum site-determining protein MinC [Marinobacterium litorale]|uniref:septum site-determining protein MinC n=1 Tax=Marinobacterium litorale TaxID=404770 RepID=UPI00041F1802|nr:septum site-determining protein MinC [Marinobacterium litorale]